MKRLNSVSVYTNSIAGHPRWLQDCSELAAIEFLFTDIISAPEPIRTKYKCCLPVVAYGDRVLFRGGFSTWHLARWALGTAAGNILCVFVKNYESVAAKTRLAAAVGPSEARQLAKIMLETTLARLLPVNCRHQVAVWPENLAGANIKENSDPAWVWTDQSEGDLGCKLADYFRARIGTWARRVVIIGADSPDLPLNYIETAFEMLKGTDCVLGPAGDGGFYLIGLRTWRDGLFCGVPWSTSETFAATIESLRTSGLDVQHLPRWDDVDDIRSLEALFQRLQSSDDPGLQKLHRPLAQVIKKWNA